MILGKPVIQAEPLDTLVSIGSDVLIHCAISEYSNVISIIEYTWQRDFTALQETDRISVFGNGSLLIKDFTAVDVGYYDCKVTIKSQSSSADPLVYKIGGAFVTEGLNELIYSIM